MANLHENDSCLVCLFACVAAFAVKKIFRGHVRACDRLNLMTSGTINPGDHHTIALRARPGVCCTCRQPMKQASQRRADVYGSRATSIGMSSRPSGDGTAAARFSTRTVA